MKISHLMKPSDLLASVRHEYLTIVQLQPCLKKFGEVENLKSEKPEFKAASQCVCN